MMKIRPGQQIGVWQSQYLKRWNERAYLWKNSALSKRSHLDSVIFFAFALDDDLCGKERVLNSEMQSGGNIYIWLWHTILFSHHIFLYFHKQNYIANAIKVFLKSNF
ncbi:hypothetical protein EGR_10943 [Echinococcus granulosus]|uniref:Uncharacterized protein n=1 Tax=Echinococcus granulosus TaxID=6210 RepID=W6UL18_ECHGR|nr:hypothetical protein EGR_10943 [Echinococcus granulosus]EUB54199.1 hypothetical protein EGR_10943 [Echinococcus granulosus]